MTRLAVGFGRGFPRIWLLPISTLTIVLGIAVTGRLSRSIVADLIAWWPIWVGLAVAAFLLRERKIDQIRMAGLVPLVAMAFVGLFIWGHLAGWAVMPSASQRLVGPEVGGYASAALTAEADGIIVVEGGSEFLYRVEPVKRGGGVGIPGAGEQVIDSSISVELQPPADPGLYTYAGWDIALAVSPRWALSLAGAIDADLSSLTIDELALEGSGVVILGTATSETSVRVDGTFRIVVPEGVPARVNGTASVPASWSLDGSGATAPSPGTGWVITVGPEATVTVYEASEPG